MEPHGVKGELCRLRIDHLSPAQVALLRNVLNSHDTSYGLSRDSVLVHPSMLKDAMDAIEWVALDISTAEVFDDPDYRSELPPVVRPPRSPLHDGRSEASRARRLCAGLLDETLVGVPTLLAYWAGAPGWTSAVIHAMYYVVPTALWGWSIGKLWCGLRVVDRHTLATPTANRSLVRWAVAALPLLAALAGLLEGDWLGAAVMAINAPILVNLRGAHDYAAGTLVAERTAAGPGVWIGRRRRV